MILEIENGCYYHIVIKIYISISEYGIRNDELLKLGEDEEDLKSCRDYPDCG